MEFLMMSNDKLRTQIAALLDLKNRDASTRMRWWAVMNGWGVPEDLPEGCAEKGFRYCDGYNVLYPKWCESLQQIHATLSAEQASWGWWRQRDPTGFGHWSKAWSVRHAITINELGEPK